MTDGKNNGTKWALQAKKRSDLGIKENKWCSRDYSFFIF